jgi:hypothetical protein
LKCIEIDDDDIHRPFVPGAASVVRGLSAYVDSLANNVISNWFLSTMPMNSPAFGEYIDLFAFAVIMLFTCKFWSLYTSPHDSCNSFQLASPLAQKSPP